MAGNPLEVLLRLRRLAVDQARQGLAECVAAETIAIARCNAVEAAMARELDAASKITADDRAVEDFAIWLHRTLPERSAAEAALLGAETQTKEARMVLGAARAGVRAVESMLERKETERLLLVGRTEQLALDEAVRRRPH